MCSDFESIRKNHIETFRPAASLPLQVPIDAWTEAEHEARQKRETNVCPNVRDDVRI